MATSPIGASGFDVAMQALRQSLQQEQATAAAVLTLSQQNAAQLTVQNAPARESSNPGGASGGASDGARGRNLDLFV